MDSLLNFELSITLFLQSLGSWLATPFKAISLLATEEFIILIMPLIYWSIDSLMGLRMAFMLVISGSFNNYFKVLFHSPRPFWFDARVKSYSMETGFGMPSGHSQNAASLFGMMAATIRKKVFTIAVLVLIFLVGLSRLYLGMHFLRDVLSGWLLGGLFVLLYMRLEKPVAKWLVTKNLAFQVLMSFVLGIVLILLGFGSRAISASWQMPAEWIKNAALTGGAVPDPFNMEGTITLGGVAFGFMAGYALWVKKFGQPKALGSFMKRFLRYIVGIVGVVALYLGLKMIFPEEPIVLGFILRFVRYSIIGLWVTYFAPLLFKKLKLEK
jgi:membrane-associated phospholipid phosphatase